MQTQDTSHQICDDACSTQKKAFSRNVCRPCMVLTVMNIETFIILPNGRRHLSKSYNVDLNGFECCLMDVGLFRGGRDCRLEGDPLQNPMTYHRGTRATTRSVVLQGVSPQHTGASSRTSAWCPLSENEAIGIKGRVPKVTWL